MMVWGGHRGGVQGKCWGGVSQVSKASEEGFEGGLWRGGCGEMPGGGFQGGGIGVALASITQRASLFGPFHLVYLMFPHPTWVPIFSLD